MLGLYMPWLERHTSPAAQGLFSTTLPFNTVRQACPWPCLGCAAQDVAVGVRQCLASGQQNSVALHTESGPWLTDPELAAQGWPSALLTK